MKLLADNVVLRSYQKEGIEWLGMLSAMGAHGILADEMGLGKTLQALTAIAGTKSVERQEKGCSVTSSLVVCPSTLVHHWLHEATSFFTDQCFVPILYSGNPEKRRMLAEEGKLAIDDGLIITSYDTLRKDIGVLGLQVWDWVVLDECHLLRNPKSKVATAARNLRAKHRIGLTGTPIHNCVRELWVMFEFLMPGYLGQQDLFRRDFVKPISDAQDIQSVTAYGISQLQRLHEKVLPFIMRREKSAVLKELPPKIISDVWCELVPSQKSFYNSLVKQFAAKKKTTAIAEDQKNETSNENFKSIRLLMLACVHPWLVMKMMSGSSGSTIFPSPGIALRESGKLLALRDLFCQCGIGQVDWDRLSEEPGKDDSREEEQPSQQQALEHSHRKVTSGNQQPALHRCLIFGQHRSSLDAVEEYLLKIHMPSVVYRRLDGSVPITERQMVVDQFNQDERISILLLTTKVGGLGLNLTGANTVIFLEHDWNPQNDLQAMDRAHRLGQLQVVTVYRIICKDSIEEKISTAQKFKLGVSGMVINRSNSSQNPDFFDLLGKFEESSMEEVTASNAMQPAFFGPDDGESMVMAGLSQENNEDTRQLSYLRNDMCDSKSTKIYKEDKEYEDLSVDLFIKEKEKLQSLR